MSLEQELARNTEALIALTAALSKTAIFPVIETKTTPANQMIKVTPAETEALKEVELPKPVVSFEPAIMPVTPFVAVNPSSTIEYAQVAAAIVAMFKVDRARTVAALAKFGAAKGPQVKPEDYAALLKELTT